jgi:glutamyl-tRNA synthetase
LNDLAQAAAFYVLPRPLVLNDSARKILTPAACEILSDLRAVFDALPDFTAASIEQAVRDYAEFKSKKLGDAAQPLRAALSGSNVSPPVFEVAFLLGKQETLDRIDDARLTKG